MEDGEKKTKTLGADEYRVALDLWVDEVKTQRKDKRQHVECDARAYALLLQHCPPSEEETLKADSRWEEARSARSGLGSTAG